MSDAAELIGVRMSIDGQRLCLRVRDEKGKTVSFSFPTCWMHTLISAVPPPPEPDKIHTLAGWSMRRPDNSTDLILTLRTPEGHEVSFAMKPWQVEGMATIATYGNSNRPPDITVH